VKERYTTVKRSRSDGDRGTAVKRKCSEGDKYCSKEKL
jgi:hypothetical protein